MNNNNPLVSIIIRTYNRAYCLSRTIDSVIDQTYDNWEIILVDNHSTDSTYSLVSAYNDKRIRYYLIHNYGIIASSTNLGLHHSNGVYIAFLDSDDWWFPNKLMLSIQALESGYDLIYHDIIQVTQDSRTKRVKSRQLKKPVFYDLLFYGNTITCSSVVVRKTLMDKINGFSEDSNILAAEDYDAWLRIAKLTDLFYHLNEYLLYYSWGGDNLSNFELTIPQSQRLMSLYLKIGRAHV